jgi:hypothetical protein
LRAYANLSLKYDDPDAVTYRAVLALADLYAMAARAATQPELLTHAFTCVDYATTLASSSWLPDLYCKVAYFAPFFLVFRRVFRVVPCFPADLLRHFRAFRCF